MTTTQRNLLEFVNTKALQYEKLADQIFNAYELFQMEIEDPSASVAHEADLCVGDILQIIDEYKNNTTTNR